MDTNKIKAVKIELLDEHDISIARTVMTMEIIEKIRVNYPDINPFDAAVDKLLEGVEKYEEK